MKESDNNNRRGFLRKIFTLTASAGVAGLLLDRLPGKSVIQPVEAASMTIDAANSGSGTTALTSPGNPALTATNSGSGSAIQGTCTAGTGVMGIAGGTSTGTGVQGVASNAGGTALAGFAGDPGAIPIVAQGAAGQTAHLQDWRNGSGTQSVVDASGRIGIGTTTPGYPLDVVATAGDPLHITTSGANRTGFLLDATPGQQALMSFLDGGVEKFQFGKQTDNSFFFYDNATGGYPLDVHPANKQILIGTNTNYQIGIGTASPSHLLQLAGGAYSDGTTWTSVSSVRWKENFTPLTDAIETLKQLHPVSYNYKKTPAKRTMGFIAEEVGKVLPTVVDWDKAEPGYAEGYDHLAILALSVQAMKELAARGAEQQRQIELMKEQYEYFKDENEKLRERITVLEQGEVGSLNPHDGVGATPKARAGICSRPL